MGGVGLKRKTQKHGAKWDEKGARGVRKNRFRNRLGTRGIGGNTISQNM